MAITFVNAGALAEDSGSGGNITPGLPASIQANDILVLVISAADNVVCTVPAAYTKKLETNSGTIGRQTIAWARATGSDSAPLVTHTAGNAIGARILAYRGCITSGDPFSTTSANAVAQGAGTTLTATTITPANNEWVLFIASIFDNGTSNILPNMFSGWSGTTPAFTERTDDPTNGLNTQAWDMGTADGISNGSATGSRTVTLANGMSAAGTSVSSLLSLKVDTNFGVTIPRPSGVTQGCAMVALIAFFGFDSNAVQTSVFTDPPGWASAFPVDPVDVSANGLSLYQMHVAIRVAGAVEPLSYTWGATTPNSGSNVISSGYIIAYENVDVATPQDVAATSVASNSSFVAPPSITTKTPNALVLSAVVSTGTPRSPATPRFSTFDAVNNVALAAADGISQVAGVASPPIWALVPGSSVVLATIALRPARTVWDTFAIKRRAVGATTLKPTRSNIFRRHFQRQGATGTAFTQAVAGVLLFSGGLTRGTGKALPATLPLIGAASRTIVLHAYAGTLSFIGTIAKQPQRALTGTLSLAGNITRRPGKLLTGTLSFVGTIVSRAITHTLSATLALIGTTAKFTSRALTATLALIGAMTKTAQRALAGTLSFVGALTRRAGKLNAATLSFVGSIPTRAITRTLAATLALIGVVNKFTRRMLQATLLGTSSTVAFQSVANNRVASTTVTITAFDPGSGANRLLVVFIGSDFDRSSTMAVTYGGTGLTLVPGTRGGAGAAWSEFWYLINPSSTPSDVVATWTSTANISMAALAFNGVNQTTAVQNGGTSGGSGSTPNITITSAAMDMTVAGVTGQLAMSASTQTERWNDTGSNAMTAGSTAPGAATVNHQWTTTAGFSNQISGLDVVAFSSGTGGTLIKQTRRTLAGTLSFVGAVVAIKAFGRVLQATLSFVGSQTKQTNKALPATLFLIGLITRFVTYPLAATLSWIGAVTKQTRRTTTATLSFVGNIIRQPGKVLPATLSLVGTQTRFVGKGLSATLSVIGTVTKFTTRTLPAATLALLGSVTKQANRFLAGTLFFVGAVSTLKAFGRLLQATLSFVGSQTRQTNKALPATLALIGAVTKRISRTLTATVALLGSLVKQTARLLTATLSFVGTTATLKAFGRLLQATLSFVGNQTRQTNKALPATVSFVGSVNRFITYPLAATLALIGTLTKQTRRGLAAILSFVGTSTQIRLFVRTLVATLSFVGSQTKQTGKLLPATVGFVGAITRFITRPLAATLFLTGAALKRFPKNLAGALAFSGAVLKQAQRRLTATLSLATFLDATKSFIRSAFLTATLGLSGVVTRRTTKSLRATLFLSGIMTRVVNPLRGFVEYLTFFLGRTAYRVWPNIGTTEFAEVLRGTTSYGSYFSGQTVYLKQ